MKNAMQKLAAAAAFLLAATMLLSGPYALVRSFQTGHQAKPLFAASTETGAPVKAHHLTHEGGGSDEIAAATTAVAGLESAADKAFSDQQSAGLALLSKHVDDFMGGGANGFDLPWRTNVSGTNAAIAPTTTHVDDAHPGVSDFYSGTGTTGVAAAMLWASGGSGAIRVLGSAPELYVRANVWVNQLSTVTDEYAFRFDLSDNGAGASGTNRAGFEYLRTSSVNWRICVTKASADSCTNTSVAVATTGWTFLEMTKAAGATDLVFKINGANVGTILGSDTNYPIVGIGPRISVLNSAGTAIGRHVYVDSYEDRDRRSTARFP